MQVRDSWATINWKSDLHICLYMCYVHAHILCTCTYTNTHTHSHTCLHIKKKTRRNKRSKIRWQLNPIYLKEIRDKCVVNLSICILKTLERQKYSYVKFVTVIPNLYTETLLHPSAIAQGFFLRNKFKMGSL